MDCRFPPTWPVYAPARKVGEAIAIFHISRWSKLANWLESYADALELNVWTSSTTIKAIQDPSSKYWNVTVQRANGTECIFNVKHVIFATGIDGAEPKMPKIPGLVSFLTCDINKEAMSFMLRKNLRVRSYIRANISEQSITKERKLLLLVPVLLVRSLFI